MCWAESRQSVGIIKDTRGDRDGLARTLVKVLMVAGHAASLFNQCVRFCVCICDIERDGGRQRRR